MSGNAPNPLPPDRNVGPALIAWTSTLTALSVITTILRLIVRKGNRALGWDDWTILATITVATARSGVNIKGATEGYGRHKWYLPKAQQEKVNMFGWYGQVLLFITLFLLKTSICILILRIKKTKSLKMIVYPLLAVLFLTNILPVIVLLSECRPVATFWRPSAGKCWDPKIRIYSIYVQASYSVFSDFICSILPIFLLKNLSMPLRTKVAVCGLMAMGLVATACGAVRASTLGTKPNDITYDYAVTAMWSNTEIHLGIVATNLSLCRAMWAYFFGRSTDEPSDRSRSYKTGSGYSSSRRPSHFLRSIDLLHTQDKDGDDINIGERRSSKSSDVPLAPLSNRTAITKTTEVVVSEGSGSARDSDEAHRNAILGNHQAAWNVTPSVKSSYRSTS